MRIPPNILKKDIEKWNSQVQKIEEPYRKINNEEFKINFWKYGEFLFFLCDLDDNLVEKKEQLYKNLGWN